MPYRPTVDRRSFVPCSSSGQATVGSLRFRWAIVVAAAAGCLWLHWDHSQSLSPPAAVANAAEQSPTGPRAAGQSPAGSPTAGQRVKLSAEMLTAETPHGNPEAMIDEQDVIEGDPPRGEPKTNWSVDSRRTREGYPAHAYLDLGRERFLRSAWVFDTNNTGKLILSVGTPDQWQKVAEYDCRAYRQWVEIPLHAKTRSLRVSREEAGALFAELVLYEETEEQHRAAIARREAEAKAKAEREAAAARLQAEREAGLARARAELPHRPVIDLGEPFGRATLVDQIDAAAEQPGHLFTESPAGVSQVVEILGRRCRVLNKTPGEAAYMAFRIGQYKLLRAGGRYVLEIEYPEDMPRSFIVLNSGNESSVGFHTGTTVGDAFRPKYVNNLCESLRVPLSGRYESWRMFFNLHDRFCELSYPRGEGPRPLTPDDGFTVVVGQFSAENLPVGGGAAVSRIRLFELNDEPLPTAYRLPPNGLPRRAIFWREEMADNVFDGEKEGQPGVNKPIDWYRFKAEQMQLLGIDTYGKDLLEFGAVQHWDTTPYGGNQWAYFNSKRKDLWAEVVAMMGGRGFRIMPYYEYAGSRGRSGLGHQRRARPLSRDDAYTHIRWIESSNADITDLDTHADLKKMLDLTILRLKDQAEFVGAWMRPRSQWPIGFADSTRNRFAAEANNGREITRQRLREDPALLARYTDWWYGKRRDFLAALRDYLRENGLPEAVILFTAHPGEPGVSFPWWEPTLVTDDPAAWAANAEAVHYSADRKLKILSIEEVVAERLYLKALLAPPLNWGGWEVHHASPPPDPARYKQTPGVLLSHAFNRLYTVSSPATFDTFRGPSGLAVVRHYALNEDMMFDRDGKPKLGYFCADVERAGPYCMMAEATAVAHGDPTMIGYLTGRTLARGFPYYVRRFNAAFLSLPALPSEKLEGACDDPQIVVRRIVAPGHGTYYAAVNLGMTDKQDVAVRIGSEGLRDAVADRPLPQTNGITKLSFYPFELKAFFAPQ